MCFYFSGMGCSLPNDICFYLLNQKYKINLKKIKNIGVLEYLYTKN